MNASPSLRRSRCDATSLYSEWLTPVIPTASYDQRIVLAGRPLIHAFLWMTHFMGAFGVQERNAVTMASVPKPPINISLPDGKVVDGTAWTTTPLDIATGISKGLANATCVASVRYSKRLAGIAASPSLCAALHCTSDPTRT